MLEGQEKLAAGPPKSPSGMAQPVGGQTCSGLEAASFYSGARETWASRSDGLALHGASVTRGAPGSKSPAFEGQDGHPRQTTASEETT